MEMAKEKEHEKHESEHKGGEGKGGKKKLHLHAITTRKLKDGTYVHEHHYKDHPDAEYTPPPRMMGTSRDLDDVHQHLEDNFGEHEGDKEDMEHEMEESHDDNPEDESSERPEGGEEEGTE